MDDEDENDTRRLFQGLPSNKRVGVLRSFHRHMYVDEPPIKKKSSFRKCQDYFFYEHLPFGFGLSISFVLVLTGILAIVYGFMIPAIFQTLDLNSSLRIKIRGENISAKVKEKFLMAGIGIISGGAILAIFSIFIPLCRDIDKKRLQKEEQELIMKQPILVDYELTPYNIHSGNLYTVSDSSSDYTPSPGPSPIHEQDTFQPFYIQQDFSNPNTFKE